MKKLVHGSKAFLDQIAMKLLIHVALVNINNNNYVKEIKTILLSQLKRRVLTFTEKENLRRKENVTEFEEVIESTRIKIGAKVFHSKFYNRKINTNSYTISFILNGEIEYGEILNFFQHKNKIYANVNVFRKLVNDVMPDKISGFFYETFENLYEQFYSLIFTDQCNQDIISVDEIKFKCIMINHHSDVFPGMVILRINA